ncbi:hypothetical protein K6U06_09550 [Acidiferrimicrobium sp. IK]|uniref:hypothetical protein n=1 Tax=Acidiferrimicrobium sp. IK TaxID=2871700 RepID=UPI0021CB7127|nr:hypothetical protein [Acidiferrimicrobium sp. IK]MCU4184602.1 hypothetical protein [Acidiferrimicrobium sp. IK]
MGNTPLRVRSPGVRSLQANDAGRAGALKAATTFGGIVSSYNYKQPSSFTRAEQMETPQYAKTSASQAADLTKLLIQYKGISEGRVLAAGLSSYSSTHAGVLLFVDQNVSNSVEKTGTANQPLRVEVSLVRGHGRWLVDNLSVPS